MGMESQIELLKVDADQCKIKIQALTEELRNHKELSRLMTVTESCLELANHGITTSKEYDLDPDGVNRGQIPIKAHCSLPEGVTKIGDELEIEISHCGSQGSFTHEISYDSVTIDQIIALIQSSTECYQKIEYHCLSTPLAVSVTGEKMISLKDRNGTEYWPESLGNLKPKTCNHIYPQWMKDVEYIKDMDVLPITGFSYGPMTMVDLSLCAMQSEVQEAKVKLGPLTCHQDANSISKNSELENIKKVINGCLIKTCLNQGSCMGIENDFKCSCPPGFTGKRCETNIDECINNPCGINGECTDDINGFKCLCNSGFSGQTCNTTCPLIRWMSNQNVEGRCYYFIDNFTYDSQKKFCKTLFSGNGRPFEPQDLATFNKVYSVAKSKLNNGRNWWMGIRDPFMNGTLTFESNGLPLPFTIPADVDVDVSDDCVLFKTLGKWIR